MSFLVLIIFNETKILNIFTSFFNEKLASNLRVTSLPKQVNKMQGLTRFVSIAHSLSLSSYSSFNIDKEFAQGEEIACLYYWFLVSLEINFLYIPWFHRNTFSRASLLFTMWFHKRKFHFIFLCVAKDAFSDYFLGTFIGVRGGR